MIFVSWVLFLVNDVDVWVKFCGFVVIGDVFVVELFLGVYGLFVCWMVDIGFGYFNVLFVDGWVFMFFMCEFNDVLVVFDL